MGYAITTQSDLRSAFWEAHEQLRRAYFRRSWRQNQYPTDVRVPWCDYVESCHRDGLISDALAQRATL